MSQVLENIMGKYGLAFLTDDELFEHVKQTVEKYRFHISLNDFNKNLIDPIKLTFDAQVYGKSLKEIIEAESIRQIDKSNTNHIGYFHQNIFNYIGQDWDVPKTGYDVVNASRRIFVEMKNKHNTMNSSSAQKTYIKMQNTILRDDKATCYLVEVIAKKSQDIAWQISIDSEPFSNKNIRRISIDKFYEIVTGRPTAFRELCEVIPMAINDVIAQRGCGNTESTVFSELQNISPNLMKSIYLLSFEKYEGFSCLSIR
jgi:hypothetical protein